MVDQIEAFSHKIPFRCTKPPPFKEGEHRSSTSNCHSSYSSHWQVDQATPPPTTSQQTPADCCGGLTDLQRSLLLRFGPASIAGMESKQHNALPPGVQEALFHLHKEHYGDIQGIKATHKTVVWDSGASISISFGRSDFVSPLKPVPAHIKLHGIMRRIKIEGQGHIAWCFINTSDMLCTIKLLALYVSSAKARLLSTTCLLQTHTDKMIELSETRLLLSGSKATQSSTNPIEVLIDPVTNLQTLMMYDYRPFL
jgi:hypothetical protein